MTTITVPKVDVLDRCQLRHAGHIKGVPGEAELLRQSHRQRVARVRNLGVLGLPLGPQRGVIGEPRHEMGKWALAAANGRECFSRACRAFFSIGWNTLRVLAGSSRSLVLNEVITAKGQVHGKTLNAIRDRIDRFHAMNVFGDADAATKLTRLKQQIAGLSGQDLAQQPDVADKLSRACRPSRTRSSIPTQLVSSPGG